MRLLMVVDRYAPEARSAAHLFEDLAKAFVAKGHEVSVWAKQPTENLPDGQNAAPARELRDGVRVVRLPGLGEPRSTVLKALDQAVFAAQVFFCIMISSRFDAIVVYSPPLPLAAACALAGRLRALPVIVNLHDLYPRTAVELGRLRSRVLIALAKRMECFVYRAARLIVVPSPGAADYLIGDMGRPADRVRLVYNWVDFTRLGGVPNTFRADHGLMGKFVAMYAGVVGVAQDLSAIVEAARFAREDEDLIFLVIGEGSELERWKARGAGLPSLVFLPTLSRERYVEALQSSDAGLIALSLELSSPAIPGKLQNIMALAKPVLAVVPTGSAAERIVREAGCGLITKPGDGAALIDAVRRLRSDATLRRRLGEAGESFARKHFLLEAAVDAFDGALKTLGAKC